VNGDDSWEDSSDDDDGLELIDLFGYWRLLEAAPFHVVNIQGQCFLRSFRNSLTAGGVTFG